MTDENSPFVPKVDVFMPLYVGKYLQETTHLDAMKSGALLHLLMYIWVRGPLPNEPSVLATIAKLTPDAWSMCQAVLMQFLSIGPDGMLHQRGAERIKADWTLKRLKAHEKAQKAARARWSKERAKTGGKVDAPSIAQEVLTRCPTPLEEQEQKQVLPPPTPSAARRGTDAPSMLEQQNAPSIREHSGKAGAPSMPRPVELRRVESVSKAKQGNSAPGAQQNGVHKESGHRGPNGSVAGEVKALPGHQKKPVQPANGDLRRDAFREEIREFWAGQNPGLGAYEFKPADERALADLLERNPKLTLPMLQACLSNRARSEISPAADPAKWLRGVVEYVAGPLDRYQKPLKRARVF